MPKKKPTNKQTKRKPRNPRAGSAVAAVRAREREGRAVQLRLEGRTLQEIATELGYAVRSSARFAIFRGMERLSPPENLESLRAIEVARTYEVEHEAWEQWYRSTEDAVKESTKTRAGDDETGEVVTETTRTVEGQAGNPALLAAIVKAMERRAKLLGLDAPEKIDVNTKTEIRVIGQDPVQVFENAARRLRGEVLNAVGE